ncbi:hypothetical protein J3R30DRAFT_3706176 [Lentinula aciculospora]|uniref:Uncharacterized protein n=1 Tax=Lentinula aciculospora TaxID=153920 RepID=A0A9W9A8Z0_9AGAR|nr:hypothetical protein J3R30DRAFT_3706176 [Lentinula aciculospora]
MSSDSSQDPSSLPDSHKSRHFPQYETKPETQQPPPRPATTISGAFFAGASNFEIRGGEFNNTAGNMYKTIRNDYSTRSNFNNSYGHDFSGSGNQTNDYRGAYSALNTLLIAIIAPSYYHLDDNREFRSQRYDAKFTDTHFVSGGQGRGRFQGPFSPRQYEQRPNYIHKPNPQHGYPFQEQTDIGGRPTTAPPSMLEFRQATGEREQGFYTSEFDRVYNVHTEPEEISSYPGLSANPISKQNLVNTDAAFAPVPATPGERPTQTPRMTPGDIVMDGVDGDGREDPYPEMEAPRSETVLTSDH